MNSVKKIIWLIFSIFLLSQVFAIGVYDDFGDFVYYVNNPTPTIDINITAGSKSLQVEKGLLTIGSETQEFEIPVSQKNLNLFETRNYQFKIDEDVSQEKEVKFKLFVRDFNSQKLVRPFGDPVDFFIEFDNTKPELLSVQNNINSNNKLVLNFNKKIHFVKISIGSESKVFNNVQDYKLKFDNSITVDMSEFDFSSELYTIDFEFQDLAGNQDQASESIYVHGSDLTVDLLTLRDDNSLEYNYDENYADFFNGTIYSKSDNYELKVKTNKPATCYFSSQLSTFKRFNEVMEKETFLTSNNIDHRIQVDQFDNEIWVACKNVNSNSEIVYLSEIMNFGKNLISLEVYNKGELEIVRSEPKALVTNNPFSLFVDVNNRAICKYRLNSDSFELMDSSNYINFEVPQVEVSVGSHSLDFECFDVLNNKELISSTINVDPSLGVRVVDFTPKYVGKSTANVEISLSEFEGIECRYNDKRASTSEFNNFFNISGTGITRTFLVSSLVEDVNNFFVYCKKDGQITWTQIDIIYDTRGVIINDLIFVNGDYKSDYVGSETEFEIEYNISSLIPLKKVIAQVSGNNETITQEFSSDNQAVLKGNFRGLNRLKLTASNMIDVNSSKDFVLKFDLKAPEISFRNKGDLKEVVCSDIDSGCADVFYGFSQTAIDCKPNQRYNSSIDVRDKYYLCVEAFDYANQRTYKLEMINEFVDALPDFDINETQAEVNETFEPNEEETFEEIEPLAELPDYEAPESNTGTVIVIAAVALLLIGVGSGGYYAYRKGYLNNELAKLGIRLPNWENDKQDSRRIQKVSKQDVEKADKTKFTTKPISKFSKKEEIKKSTYESHLDKLNKFIDSKISKSDDVFGEFKDSGRGKVDGYHDTLAKKKTFAGKGKVSKEDYDEFYEKSSKSKVLEDKTQSLEKEAENFEEYLKKKKGKK